MANQKNLSGQDIDNILDEVSDQEDIALGSELSKIKDELNGKFGSLAQKMERQLARLRQKLEAEKQEQAALKQKIQASQQQRDEFKQEAVQKTNDLNQINEFYKNDADEQQFSALHNGIVQRHQSMQQQLQATNYSTDVSAMNKAWQDEVKKITSAILSSPSKAELASILDELQQRTKDVNTLKQIENGSLPIEAVSDLVDKAEERHAAQQGDQMAAYKTPGIIENAEVLQNNAQWDKCMALVRDFVLQNQQRLAQRNDLYMQELAGRIGDLSQFKEILNLKIAEEDETVPLYERKKHLAKIKAKKQQEANRRRVDLCNNVQQRHNQVESQAKNTLNAQSQKDQNELQSLSNNDGGWRKEFDQDTRALVEYLV
eukprot:CAMPEP_0202728030 /NCGR_PEP_ID=MMETSP1385-20130828/185422_1 /ASSEMBLY_ACC=CAM_ASM_000861 /TAXON_ID=933848 /ORGANISM="Elphidium margaritaceum" /LENGTH=372 /DNA_ID=CAMNT_0049394275 /DNA_START=43 /DNA_END=1161 /DNA_ORIENTATION=+